MIKVNFYKAIIDMNLSAKLKSAVPAFFAIALGFFVVVEPSYAGLQKANVAMEEIKVWAYSVLGIGIFLYLMYHIVMALMNKGTWADVLMGVAYSALAGGVLALGAWAWEVFA